MYIPSCASRDRYYFIWYMVQKHMELSETTIFIFMRSYIHCYETSAVSLREETGTEFAVSIKYGNSVFISFEDAFSR